MAERERENSDWKRSRGSETGRVEKGELAGLMRHVRRVAENRSEVPMARGGARAGAGRPKGAKNKKNREIANRLLASGKTPLEYMASIVESDDPNIPMQLKLEAAKAAAPYMHPRLNAVQHTGPDGGPIKVILNGSDADL